MREIESKREIKRKEKDVENMEIDDSIWSLKLYIFPIYLLFYIFCA
jgi:hypothetical protein